MKVSWVCCVVDVRYSGLSVVEAVLLHDVTAGILRFGSWSSGYVSPQSTSRTEKRSPLGFDDTEYMTYTFVRLRMLV